jgi:uncharacterized membrane protein
MIVATEMMTEETEEMMITKEEMADTKMIQALTKNPPAYGGFFYAVRR